MLDTGRDFGEPDGSQGVGGNVGEVENVNLPSTGSIEFVDGSITLYTGRNATGRSRTITHDVADLTRLGFGHTKSVRIGAVAD